MKYSGIEWMGKIPAHWVVKRLKYCGDALIGLTYDPSDVVDEGEGILVLRSSNVQNGRIVFDDNVYVNQEVPERLIVRRGDILICSRNGSRALIGKNAMIEEQAEGLTFGAFMTVFRSVQNPYLFWVLNSPLFEFQSSSFLTSTVNQLTVGNLRGFEIPLPPPDERVAITAFLEFACQRIDKLISSVVRATELLQERRTAIISAAVTGKIDVRGLESTEAA
jgi:type I restriction enzyme S subunit